MTALSLVVPTDDAQLLELVQAKDSFDPHEYMREKGAHGIPMTMDLQLAGTTLYWFHNPLGVINHRAVRAAYRLAGVVFELRGMVTFHSFEGSDLVKFLGCLLDENMEAVSVD